MTDKMILGMCDHWGQEKPVSLTSHDRRHHLHVIGKSGTGKSTFLENLAIQDIEAGRGFAFIDPHGDASARILDRIPSSRTRHVTYFDPSDVGRPMSLNLLGQVPPGRRHLVAFGVVSVFKGIFPDYFGPRMEYIFYAAVAALLDCEHVSLLGLQRMLSDDRYRAWVARQVKDPMVRTFWEREFEQYDRKTRAEMVSPVLNKVGVMLMAPALRNVLGQVRNRIEPRFMMDNGRIFIANLSKGRLGADKANLIGSLLVTQFQLAAMSRADTPETERRDFALYVDEFPSFISESFTSMLSESRKYGLSLTLAHQYLGQLKPTIAEAVMGNVGSIVTFRVGHEDAEAFEKAFGKTFAASAFTSLNNGEAYAKLLSNGRDIEPILIRTLPPHGESQGRREQILRRSRQRHASKRRDVERKIGGWFNGSAQRSATRHNRPVRFARLEPASGVRAAQPGSGCRSHRRETREGIGREREGKSRGQ